MSFHFYFFRSFYSQKKKNHNRTVTSYKAQTYLSTSKLSLYYSICIRSKVKLFYVVAGQGDVQSYTDQIESFIRDFHDNGPGSVDEDLNLGLQKLEVSESWEMVKMMEARYINNIVSVF